MTTLGHIRQVSHPAVAELARRTPGVWVKASAYGSSESAGQVARAIRHGGIRAYAPAGAFQAADTLTADDAPVWVRYVGGEEIAPAVPDTMTVRVRHDGEGPGYEGVGVLTVTVGIACPSCGAPRGFDTIRTHRFHHDGDTFTVDAWTNPCTHIDLYADVVAESRQRVRRVTRVRWPDSARLILRACGEGRIRSYKQAAALLDDHGFTDEAALIRAEARQCTGLMSAQQAAGYLRDLAAAVMPQAVSTSREDVAQ